MHAGRRAGAGPSPLQLSDDHVCKPELAHDHIPGVGFGKLFRRLDLKACGRRRTDFSQDDSGGIPRTSRCCPNSGGGDIIVFLRFSDLSVGCNHTRHDLFSKQATRKGLNTRAIGEDPATADAAAVNVSHSDIVATVTGAAIRPDLADCILSWSIWAVVVEQRFWRPRLACDALVILALWNPQMQLCLGIILSSADCISSTFICGTDDAGTVGGLLPYVVTIVVLVMTSNGISGKTSRRQDLGEHYSARQIDSGASWRRAAPFSVAKIAHKKGTL